MANQPKKPEDGVEGEGSYTASRDYKKSIDTFMAGNPDADIQDEARDAADALDSDEERPTLDKAMKQGLKRAKH